MYETSYCAITNDVIFDVQLQFTATDELDLPVLNADSKFALWLYADGGTTNLYVTAGGCGVSVSDRYNAPTNYCLCVEIDANTWYHVTVRAIRNISTLSDVLKRDMMGFVVFINEKPVNAQFFKGYGIILFDVGKLLHPCFKLFFLFLKLFYSKSTLRATI